MVSFSFKLERQGEKGPFEMMHPVGNVRFIGDVPTKRSNLLITAGICDYQFKFSNKPRRLAKPVACAAHVQYALVMHVGYPN